MNNIKHIITLVISAIFFIFVGLPIIFGSWYTVDPGHRGVIVRLGAVQPGVQGEGFHLKMPWLDSIIHMNVQVQADTVDANAASHDLQIVTTKIVTNFNLVPEAVDQVYQKIGEDFMAKIISPAVQEIVKAVTAKYTAEELITKRAEVKSQIKALLTERLIVYHIQVVDISIADFNFSKAFNDAIENKQVAEQQVSTARNRLESVKVEAEQKIAQAQAEAKSLELQKAQITPDLIKLREVENQTKAIEKWNGVLPIYTTGVTPFVNVGTK